MSSLSIARSQIDLSLAPLQLFPKELILPSPMFHNYSHCADWHIVFFLNECIGVLFLYMLCSLMVKDDIKLAINVERSGEQSRFQFEAATKFDSAL